MLLEWKKLKEFNYMTNYRKVDFSTPTQHCYLQLR